MNRQDPNFDLEEDDFDNDSALGARYAFRSRRFAALPLCCFAALLLATQ